MIIVVAAISIPVLLVVMGQSARLGLNPELHVTASNLVQALMEDVVKTNRYSGFGSVTPFSNTASVGGKTYNQTVTVCNVPDGNLNDTSSCSSPTKYKRVSAIVSTTGPTTQVELVTLVTDH